MISDTFVATAFLAAAMLFILSLGGLSNQASARRGNLFGVIGMGAALFFTLFSSYVDTFVWIAPAVLIGAAIGSSLASRVQMTAMPELVAILHSFVGLAAVLVGLSSYLSPTTHSTGTEHTIHLVEIYLGVGIGAITFTGSIIAWAKLRGSLKGTPMLLPGRH
ncbi:MAG: NAD(P) transhydrogenase subunit beta, partial [Bradymonadia bacterium]